HRGRAHMNLIKIKKLPSEHLSKLQRLKRSQHHPLLHVLHEKHKISKKTLFYMKEYGPHSHVAHTIIKESVRILLLASIISSFGGLALEQIKTSLITITPLLILLPVLNDMIGDFGAVLASKVASGLYKGTIHSKSIRDEHLGRMFRHIMTVALTSGIIASGIAIFLSRFSGYEVVPMTIAKILFISIIDIVILVSLLFFITVSAGFYFYKKKEDPNNFLIPITTSIADFGNMILLTVLIVLLF
ncbi:MAG TPA: magnesium transporter, partial [Candidatus Nanoarchaeia archaeon]|nr:magnesium transporter [Candidatus Nanoarchaeia archaeon]